MSFTLPATESSFSRFMGGFVKQGAKHIEERLDQRMRKSEDQKESQKIQQAFQKLPEDASQLDLFKTLSTLDVSDNKKKLLYEGFKNLNNAKIKAKEPEQVTPYKQKAQELKERELDIREKKLEKPQEQVKTPAKKEAEAKGITPYQEQLIKQRDVQQKIAAKRLEDTTRAREEQLPKLVATYTKPYAKDANLDPDEKVELDRFVIDSMKQGDGDVNEALQAGIEQVAQKKQMLEQVPVVDKPFVANWRPEAKEEAMQDMTEVLRDLRSQGITKVKDLQKVAKRGNWSDDEINEMLQRVVSDKERKVLRKEYAKPPKGRVKLASPAQQEEVARKLLREFDGDKQAAMQAFQERYEL